MRIFNALLIAMSLLFLSSPSYALKIPVPNPEFSCFSYKILGCCDFYCSNAIIKHRIPVLYIEVTKAIGDSVFGGVGASTGVKMGTRSMGEENNNTFEVRVWDVAEDAYSLLKKYTTCFTCPLVNAQIAAQAMQSTNSSDDDEEESCGACGFTDSYMKNAFSMTSNINGSSVSMLYDTGVDFTNWRTGCRDMGFASAMGPVIAAKCGLSGLGGIIEEAGFSGVGQGLSNLVGDSKDQCVGIWGPLMPRQMRSYTTELVAAAYAAYRAIHIAGDVLEKVKYDYSLAGVLQPSMPDMGSCYHPGASFHTVEKMDVADDGRYSFYWWVDVGCCRPWTEIVSCYGEEAFDSALGGMDIDLGGFGDLGNLFGGSEGGNCSGGSKGAGGIGSLFSQP